MPDALQCIASLVKISNKFDHISVGYIQKTAQKLPKIVLSGGIKRILTFASSKTNPDNAKEKGIFYCHP